LQCPLFWRYQEAIFKMAEAKTETKARTKAEKDPLGARMKGFEKRSEKVIAEDEAAVFWLTLADTFDITISDDDAFVLRGDGRGFSKFTRGLRQPFDPCFTGAKIDAVNHILKEFPEFTTSFDESDEFSLIKPPGKHQFEGRLGKYLTLISATFSVAFMDSFRRRLRAEEAKYDPKCFANYMAALPVFDCRVLIFKKGEFHEVVNHMIWRSVRDCEKNTISKYYDCRFGSKNNAGINGREKIAALEADGKFSYERDVPLHEKHGIFTKREQYVHTGVDHEGKEVVTTRTRLVSGSFKIGVYSDAYLDFLFAKYWHGNEALTVDAATGLQLKVGAVPDVVVVPYES
jgi:tRNA(His) guanylyltransferase